MSLWNSLLGYLNIKIEGLSLEKFLNRVGQSDIKIWNVKRVSRTVLTANIKRRDFFKLQELMRYQGLTLQIVGKGGTAKHIKFLRMRNVLLLLVPLVAFVIYAYTAFIWVIDIKGVEGSDLLKVRASLDSCGVKIGMQRSDVDQKECQRIIMKDNSSLSWVGVNIIGVKLEITAVKENDPVKIVDKSTPSNIIADKDGMVESIIALDGTAKVQKGSTFRKGDILISGMIEHTYTDPRYVCARGTIQAKTYYESTVNVNEISEKKRTGNKTTLKYIGIGNIITQIGDDKIDYKYYESENEKETVTDSFFIPLYLIKKEVYELEVSDNSGDNSEQLRKKAEELAYEKALSLVPKDMAQVLGSLTSYSSSENGELLVTVTIQALEYVGQTVPIENIPLSTAPVNTTTP